MITVERYTVEEYDGFASENDYKAYLAELEQERIAAQHRTPEAIRQEQCRRRRNTAKTYYTHWIRTGNAPPESWIAGISEAIKTKARDEAIAENQAWARLRQWQA